MRVVRLFLFLVIALFDDAGAANDSPSHIFSQIGRFCWILFFFPTSSRAAPVERIVYVNFTSTGTFTFTVPTGVTSVNLLVVAGGGGGGAACSVNAASPYTTGGGGGGAGGFVCLKDVPVTPGQHIPITVGGGGTYGDTGSCVPHRFLSSHSASRSLPVSSTMVRGSASYFSANGGNSSFGAYVAVGGGGGETDCNSQMGGSAGGSGGGASCPDGPGGAGVQGQGYAGGDSGRNQNTFYSGSGGGAGGLGSPSNGGADAIPGPGLSCKVAAGSSQIFATGGPAGASLASSNPGDGGAAPQNCGCNQDGLPGEAGIVALSWAAPSASGTATGTATASSTRSSTSSASASTSATTTDSTQASATALSTASASSTFTAKASSSSTATPTASASATTTLSASPITTSTSTSTSSSSTTPSSQPINALTNNSAVLGVTSVFQFSEESLVQSLVITLYDGFESGLSPTIKFLLILSTVFHHQIRNHFWGCILLDFDVFTT